MRIHSLHLQNFKRFTDLKIEGIPDSAKLVLLIGANGSGKSSVFDALNLVEQWKSPASSTYYSKFAEKDYRIEVDSQHGVAILSPRGARRWPTEEGPQGKFFGRSSLRVIPAVERISDPEKKIQGNQDRPARFTMEDRRFNADLAAFTARIDQALREPTFQGKAADTLAIFREHIKPLNDALKRVFGESEQTTIQILNYDNSDPGKPIQLFFKKGSSRIPFNHLSHGEKQIVILLMGFAVRREQMEDSIVFVDEMDLHLNTALQKTVLGEIVENWIPDSSQLWTASHALGFIEYAQEADIAALIDLDALDFDQPQVITPAPKSRLDLVEIAVPRESLTRLFSNRTIVICEGKDHAFYNAACDDASRLFIPPGGSDNAGSVLAMARSNPGYLALRDRDFLMENEIRAIQEELPNVRILPFYSIENLLYHPDNIASLNIPDFDPETWKSAMREWKAANPLREIKFERSRIQELRTIQALQRSKAVESEPDAIYDAFNSDEFTRFYPVFPQKRMPLDALARFNLTKDRLARASWFKQQIQRITATEG
ncbi:MAG: AAA family ATPase [Akkermansiaceae bacterium]|nr:AAA family ATPase [Akkermansiaceae bacterium]